MLKLENENDDTFLIRTCKYCRGSDLLTNLEYKLHCDGIWLHALQYSGQKWCFTSAVPTWAAENASEIEFSIDTFAKIDDSLRTCAN